MSIDDFIPQIYHKRLQLIAAVVVQIKVGCRKLEDLETRQAYVSKMPRLRAVQP